ncbi:transposase [Nocardia noduli]|uniref:transposase n=1 Tax=Nocardia noduli TaxID=2815722 RepID=UPI001C22A9B7|nr:transposase [Nocardia noduli]
MEYEIGNRGRDDSGLIRLITPLLDHEIAPAIELAAAYHHRWQIETRFAEIETSQRGSYRVLRSRSLAMVRQEIWALLTTTAVVHPHPARCPAAHHRASEISP